MMFGGPYPLTVVDWQSLTMGCPLNDVSYFMGTSLLGPDRDQEEAALIRHYLGVLKSYGVDLKFDHAFAYYRNYAPAGMIMALIASMIVGETERGNDMFMVMAKRSIEMSRSLGVLN
jgi:aminoglycoside phosphotransferase (APT) family kinase protein